MHESNATDHEAAPSARAPHHEEVSIVEALERVTQAGVEILEKRAELIQLEIKAAGSRFTSTLLRMSIAALFFVVAWIAAVGAAFFAMRDILGEAGSLGAIVAVNALLGAIILLSGRENEASTV